MDTKCFQVKFEDERITKSIRMPRDMVEKLECIAREYNTTFTSVLQQCVSYALDNMAPKEKTE